MINSEIAAKIEELLIEAGAYRNRVGYGEGEARKHAMIMNEAKGWIRYLQAITRN